MRAKEWIGLALALLVVFSCSAGGKQENDIRVVEPCAAGATDCGGVCVATASDSSHCGACGVICGPGEFCSSGVCARFCAPGESECGGQCLPTQSDPRNCGGCGVACPAGNFCDQGSCSAECTGLVCPLEGGLSACVHVESDPSHCGGCGLACGPGQACSAGKCVDACPVGFTACGGECVDLRSSASNCGTCGNACTAGLTCIEGACGGGGEDCVGDACPCQAHETDCGGTCIDTGSSPFHCGGCDITCSDEEECVLGSCSCKNGGELCNGACTDTQSDDFNCGGCGEVCPGEEVCQSGSCGCSGAELSCDNYCVDAQVDPKNCGSCGNICKGYEECIEGECIFDANPDDCGGDARGVTLSRVSIYQGVEVDLYREQSAVSTDQRAVDLIQGRKAMVRLFAEPGAGFSARELSGRIFVKNGEELQVFYDKKTLSGASSPNQLSSTFNVDIPADVIGEGTEYWAELVECGGAAPDAPVTTVRFPAALETTAQFDARKTGVIKVHFIPYRHDGRVPDTSEATMQAYIDAVERVYPTTRMEVTVLEPVDTGMSGTNILGGLLDRATSKRSDDGVESDVYYYGLVDPASSWGNYCQGGCTTGVGWVPGVSGSWANSHRVAVGVGFGTRGAGTFSHELGHNHGRNHAPCGGAGGPDPSYPYNGALIGVRGYDLLSRELKDASEYKDHMAYCSPEWISDYGFQMYVERIAALNGNGSQPRRSFSHLPEVTYFRMRVSDAGAEWLAPMTGRGAPTDHPEKAHVFDASGNLVAVVDAYRVEMSDLPESVLFVPSPQPGWAAVGVPGGPTLYY